VLLLAGTWGLRAWRGAAAQRHADERQAQITKEALSHAQADFAELQRELADRAQALLGPRLPAYGRQYECPYEDESAAVFFLEEGHWAAIGAEMGLETREWQALRRAHAEHLRQLGDDLDRSEEFETALDLREVVVIGKPAD